MNIKHITMVLLLAGGISLASCSDFLDQKDPNKISLTGYFATENDVLQAINGIYEVVRSNNALGEGSWQYYEERSDNLNSQNAQSSNGNGFHFTNFSLMPSNMNVKNLWLGLYAIVSRANFVLAHIDDVSYSDDNVRKQFVSEAKFLRALAYFHLVRIWGDVPLSAQQLNTYDDVLAHTARTPKEAVYEQIVKDLTEALDSGSLPDHQNEGGKGRTSNAAINGLLGQVYLTMATTLEGGDREADLREAEKYLTDCYDMRTFGELSEIPYSDVFDVEKKGTCPELIFQVAYIQGDRNFCSTLARYNQPAGTNLLSLFNHDPAYVDPLIYSDIIGEYEAGDARTDWSIQFSPAWERYFISKYRDASDGAGAEGYGGNDWILMRYADIMLLLAETYMHQGNDPAAISLLDEVRARAGMPSYSEMQDDSDYTSKYPTLKLAILHERRIELAFENHRWYDLLRCFDIEELTTFFRNKDRDDSGISNPHNFSAKDIYFPIPFDEWKLNPEGMYQNEGY